MCYSQRTSIISYSLAMTAAIFAFYTKQYIIGMLILFFCQMQLSELLIWRGIDNNDANLNRIGTAFGKYTLPSHNIGIALGILLFIYMSGKDIKPVDYAPLVIGILFYIVVMYIYSRKNAPSETYPLGGSCDRDCQNSQNRLVWPYNHSWYLWSFLISIMISIYYYNLQGATSQLFCTSIFIITAAFVLAFFNMHVVGSTWCFLAAVAAPLIVIGNYYLQNK